MYNIISMSLRSFDSSSLTTLKQNQNQAYFFNRQSTNMAPTNNPQTGKFDCSKVSNLTTGVLRNSYRGEGISVSQLSCACAPGLINAINRNNC